MSDFLDFLSATFSELDHRHFPLPKKIGIEDGGKVFWLNTPNGYPELLKKLSSLESKLSPEMKRLLSDIFRQTARMHSPSTLESFVAKGGIFLFEKNYANNEYRDDGQDYSHLLFGGKGAVSSQSGHFTPNLVTHELAHQFFVHQHSIHEKFFTDCLRADRDMYENSTYPILQAERKGRDYEKDYSTAANFRQSPLDGMKREKLYDMLDALCHKYGKRPGSTDLYLDYVTERENDRHLFAELFCIANEYCFGDSRPRKASPLIDAYLHILVPLDAEISAKGLPPEELLRQRDILKQALDEQDRKLFGPSPLPLSELISDGKVTDAQFQRCFAGTFKIEHDNKEEVVRFTPDVPGACWSGIKSVKQARYALEYNSWLHEGNPPTEVMAPLQASLQNQRAAVEKSLIGAMAEVDRDVRRKLGLKPSHTTNAYIEGVLSSQRAR